MSKDVKVVLSKAIAKLLRSGLLITVLTLVAIELLSRTVFEIPNPAPIYLTAVVYAAFNGGLRSGLYSAAITLLYAVYFFSTPGKLDYTTDNLQHLIVLAVTTPAITVMVGILQRRNEGDMNKQKQVESALRESEIAVRLLIESAKDYAIFMLDPNGYISSWNSGAESILGYESDEIVGQHGSCIFTPEDRKKGEDKKELQTAIAKGRAEDERWHVRQDGTRFWGSGIVTPLRDEAGNLLGLSKIMRDRTEQKQADAERDCLIEQLAAERSHLEAVVQQMPVGVVSALAPSGELILHNKEALQILHHPLLPSNSVDDYVQYGAFHPDGQPYKSEEYPIARSVISGETVKAEEMNYWRGDRTETFLSVNSAPIIDQSGNIVAAVSTFYDIYERKRAELALQQSEERLRLTLEAANMSTWEWNILTNQFTCSYNHKLLFGLTLDTLGDYEAFLSRIHPEDREFIDTAVNSAIQQRTSYDAEFRIVLPDGSIRWLAAKGKVFYDETGTTAVRMIGISMDITQRKQAAEQIKLSRQETAELKRLNQLKDDFLSTVSHELRTPISNMGMAIKMLKLSLTNTDERSQRYLEILQTECTREIDLINDLLDLQRLETASYPKLDLESINLQNSLLTLIEPFRARTQERQQTLHIDLPPDFPEIISDRTSLERVLTELLNNACKYTFAGGEIILSVHHKVKRDEEGLSIGSIDLEANKETDLLPLTPRSFPLHLQSSPETRGSSVIIFTISNSAEIPALELPRIFDKFYRIPKGDPWKQGGTGLGLALVQKLVEQLRGTIQVESSGGWTTFTVQLPDQPIS